MSHETRQPHSHPRVIALSLLATVCLVGCSSNGPQIAAEQSEQAVEAYVSALTQFAGSTESVETGLARFTEAYADLTDPQLSDRIDEVYAPELFFNDTIHTFTDREALKAYMEMTGANLSESKVEVHQVLQQDADVFVRWTMYFQIGDGPSAIRSNSIGMTHLRFNTDGQVILHQDYWDSAGALFSHLPIVGTVLRAAKDQIGKE